MWNAIKAIMVILLGIVIAGALFIAIPIVGTFLGIAVIGIIIGAIILDIASDDKDDAP